MKKAALQISIKDVGNEIVIACTGDTDFDVRATPSLFVAAKCMEFIEKELKKDER